MAYRKRRLNESEDEYMGELRAYYRLKSDNYRSKNREKTLEYTRRASTKRRIKILEHYGGIPPKCNCCGETIIQVLEIDHINGGGRKQRKELGDKWGGPVYFYLWVIKNNFPEGLQVLCMNCNRAKGILGVCPHREDVTLGPIRVDVQKTPIPKMTVPSILSHKTLIQNKNIKFNKAGELIKDIGLPRGELDINNYT